MTILVLCGGESAERIVSLASGDAVAAWCTEAGYTVFKYDPEVPGAVSKPDVQLAPEQIGLAAPLPKSSNGYNPAAVKGLLNAIETCKPDVIFPILHGGRGEDGTLQALLDWVGVVYTGSSALSSAMAMNKPISRLLFEQNAIPIARGVEIGLRDLGNVDAVKQRIVDQLGFPVVVKPACGGSTVGLTKVYKVDELAGALAAVAEQHDSALIEELFEGREMTVSIVDGEAYPVIEIRPKVGFYDYANKYTSGRTDYLCPAPVSTDASKLLQRHALSAYHTLGCAGFSRVDFLLDDAGKCICLEVNTLPGMTKNSLVPKAARAKGEEPPQLMKRIITCALRNAGKA